MSEEEKYEVGDRFTADFNIPITVSFTIQEGCDSCLADLAHEVLDENLSVSSPAEMYGHNGPRITRLPREGEAVATPKPIKPC